MKNIKPIAIISLAVVAVTLILIFIPSLFADEPDGYSPAPVNPPPENVSEPVSNEKPENLNSYQLAVDELLANKGNLKTSFVSRLNVDYIEKIKTVLGEDVIEKLASAVSKGELNTENLKSVTGYSEKAFVSLVEGNLVNTEVLSNSDDGTTDMVFVGDVSFADGYSVMNHYKSRNKGAEGIVSSQVLEIMRSADIAMANNEFTLTTRGAPVPDKKFTFRGNPANASIYHEMGVDIVGLANNHAFDYGADSLTDTLLTLDAEGIAHVGAGENLSDAKAAHYYIVNGYKIAIVAGSAIDRYSTRGATDSRSGVFQIFDTVSMSREISAAKEKADFVIAYVHWGIESTTELTSGQKSMGKAFVDAGADVVVGMHSHCMQGVEYYKGKLIVYSLGNFTFSRYSLTCGMLETSISASGEILNKYYPMMQVDNFTYINSEGEKGKSQLELLRSISVNADVSDDFIVTEVK